MITLAKAAELGIRSEGERAFPNECCGVLLGALRPDDTRAVQEILPVDNAREAPEQYHRFVIGAEDVLRAEREARRKGLDVLGFYHSHPDHPAAPSEYDQAHALPFYSYVIVSVEARQARNLTSWCLSEDRAQFFEEVVLYASECT
jgi:proteasome lid subunit RPN8/RPN11